MLIVFKYEDGTMQFARRSNLINSIILIIKMKILGSKINNIPKCKRIINWEGKNEKYNINY